MSVQDRSLLLEWLRSELVGPCLADHHAGHRVIEILSDGFELTQENLAEFRPVFYHPRKGLPLDELICHPQETPKGRYGIGLLDPEQPRQRELQDLAAEEEGQGGEESPAEAPDEEDAGPLAEEDEDADDEELINDAGEDLEISVQDRFQPSTMGVSFFAEL